ncbi:phosphatase 2C-like domain-containing protein [Lipomyces arxii]|uniref:phosphatase 2C-like domain-containing protein n=1 Tax=Lipomyces arxii TaxID=56418 RepID=UPI0034CDAC21
MQTPVNLVWTIADSYKFFIKFSNYRGSVKSCKSGTRVQTRRFTSYYVTEPTTIPSTQKAIPRLRIPLLHAPTHFGHFTSRVNRLYNQDRYTASVLTVPSISSLAPKSERSPHNRQMFFYSLFDGHGGAECSEFLARKLATYIENCDLNSIDRIEQEWKDNVGGYWARWKGQLARYSRMMSKDSDLMLRVPLAFLQADYDFTKQDYPSGSTCTSVFIYTDDPTKPYWADTSARLTIAHVGDTKCIISDRNGEAHALTGAHHLSSPIESARLRRYAASFFTDSFGEERFGNVENTRAFGDKAMKRLGVTAEPDMSAYTIGSKTATDGFGGSEPFLVIVSDGITKFASDQEIVDLVTSTGYRSGYARGTPQDAAREVVQFAADVGGDDNATCLVVRLSGWGKWNKPMDRTGDLREYRLKEAFDKSARRQ